MKINDLNQQTIKDLFTYKDGLLLRNFNSGPAKKGDIAGNVDERGYVRINVGKKKYRAHRLIYIYHHGVIPENMQVDHIDQNKSNNKIENLRLVTHQENHFNKQGKGYSYRGSDKVFEAYIRVDGILLSLGRYKTAKEASAAYKAAKKVYHKIGG